eukprot:TRINITY_DN2740_c0_g1_i12.p1 TRINITY_DN2740_c0_g1~~TRINITY_DN2740_c0_g1_i12.p1  ORF type:complete len:276 (-),score=70.64 TRINITY_DN2740_c0_g1_i12:147-974(-)
MEAKVILGECTKCSDFCTEYNNNSYHEVTQEEVERALKLNMCAVCNCPADLHNKHTFTCVREWEAYSNMSALYHNYGLENALEASVNDTEKLQLSRENYTYGEISLLSFWTILKLAEVKDGDVFYDLGCGAAKPVAYAAFGFPFAKCVGIEQLPQVYGLGKKFAKEYEDGVKEGKWMHTDYELLPSISIVEGSFLEVDFSEADVIYLACTTFTEDLMKSIARRCAKLKKGTRIISLFKPMPSVQEPGCAVSFKLYHNQNFVMSWGLEPVFFHVKE